MSIIKCCKQFSCILHLNLVSRIYFVSVFFFLSSVYAFDASVNASVSASQVSFGDSLTYKIEVEAQKGSIVEVPNFVGMLDRFDLVEWKTEGNDSGATYKVAWIALLNTFDTGDLELPRQTVLIVNGSDSVQILTDPLVVRVSSTLSEEELKAVDANTSELDSLMDVLEVENPMEDDSWEWYVYVGIALGILVIIVLIVVLIVTILSRKVRPISPYDEASLALHKLKEWNIASIDQAAYFMELGTISRRYVERRFNVNVLDATPVELKKRVASVNGLQESFKEGLVTMAEETEPVKFAKMKLGEDRVEYWMSFVDRLLQSTKPTEQEAKVRKAKNVKV